MLVPAGILVPFVTLSPLAVVCRWSWPPTTRTRLEDAGLGSEQIKVVVSGYEHKKGQLRQVLGRTG